MIRLFIDLHNYCNNNNKIQNTILYLLYSPSALWHAIAQSRSIFKRDIFINKAINVKHKTMDVRYIKCL